MNTWSEQAFEFQNELHFNEFIGWFYPRPDADDGAAPEGLGDWNNRAVARQDDIRQIAYLISEAPSSFDDFRHELDLEKSYAHARALEQEKNVREKYDPVEDVFESIAASTRALENLPFKLLRGTGGARLREALRPLEDAIDAIRGSLSDESAK